MSELDPNLARREGPAQPQPETLSLLGLGVAGVCLATVLCIMYTLRESDRLLTSAWGHDSHLFGARFGFQLAVLFVGAAVLQFVPRRWAPWVLVADALVCLAVYGPPMMFLSLGLLLAWFGLLELPLPPLPRILVGAGFLALLGLLGAMRVLPRAYDFSMMFSLRLVMYAWHRWQRDFAKERFSDYALFVLLPPLVVLPPYLTIIPFYGEQVDQFKPRLDRPRLRRALVHLALGLGYALALGYAVGPAVGRGLNPALKDLDRLVPGFGIGLLPTVRLYVDYLVMVARVAEVAHLSYGLLLVYGMDFRLPINRPLLARSYLELWSRFQIHQKDLQVALFYTPTLMRYRRKNRYLVIVAALVLTLVVGNTLMHVLIRYVYNIDTIALTTANALRKNLLNAGILAATLCLMEWRVRHHQRAPTGVLWKGLTWFGTLTMAAWIS
ncbi:MAG: hypothetical protein ABI584_16135 [Acidobacteriota bacterium]